MEFQRIKFSIKVYFTLISSHHGNQNRPENVKLSGRSFQWPSHQEGGPDHVVGGSAAIPVSIVADHAPVARGVAAPTRPIGRHALPAIDKVVWLSKLP